MGVEDAGVRANGVDAHIAHRFRGGDEGVGQCAGGHFDDEIVDREAGAAFHDIEREDIRADPAEGECEGAEASRSIRKLHAEQV